MFQLVQAEKIPLRFTDKDLPQHIQPSQGAFGIITHIFLHKGFKREKLHFYLVNRNEFLFENDQNYQYGTSFNTSLFASKSIINNLTGTLEIRNELKLRDKYLNKYYDDSGNNIISIVPQISYKISDFFVSASFDYPVFRHYNGHQLANNFGFGLSLSWIGSFK